MALFDAPTPTSTPTPSPTSVPEVEEFYSSWSLFLVCMLLILSLWTSYYLQIKRIRAIHETLVSIFAGMFVGLVIRLAKMEDIQTMLVSSLRPFHLCERNHLSGHIDVQTYHFLQSTPPAYHPQLGI
jgi:hypothetical protein